MHFCSLVCKITSPSLANSLGPTVHSILPCWWSYLPMLKSITLNRTYLNVNNISNRCTPVMCRVIFVESESQNLRDRVI